MGGETLNRRRLPIRVESRDSIQVCYDNIKAAANVIERSTRVIVETACGETRFGDLKVYQRILRQTAKPEPATK